MTTLYMDCPSGISGDMLVGALADCGVDEQVFHDAVAALALPGLSITFQRESRQGISGIKFRALLHNQPVGEAGHHHTHDHGHNHTHNPNTTHAHSHGRTHRQIRELISRAHALPEPVRQRALAVFERIAIAEGRIHHLHPDDVHFHEVGADDSIADIVCACAGIHALAPTRILCSKLFVGTGSIHCAHGHYPLPAPATTEILKNIPLRQIDRNFEFITPTGAALVAEFAQSFGPMPDLSISSIGYGLGTLDPPHYPNVLRLLLAQHTPSQPSCPPSHPDSDTEQAVLIEANLDDCSPEVAADACERILTAGALDCWLIPIIMKKGRPAFTICIICSYHLAESIVDKLFKYLPTLGCRLLNTSRRIQTRRFAIAATPWGQVRVKIGEWKGSVEVIAAEYEDCRALAESSGASVREIMQMAANTVRNQLAAAKHSERRIEEQPDLS